MDKMTFNRLITPYNRTKRTDKKNEWLTIHYVGAVSSAENNAKYFYSDYRGASAQYFVDPVSIWQSVEDYDDAWHVGGAKKYYNSCRNNNSIAIEMCCKKNAKGEWYFEDATIENTLWLSAMICKKYNIDINHVTTHYLTTHKNCPAPFVKNPSLWEDFKNRLEAMIMEEEKELTMLEKLEAIKDYYGFDNNTGNYFLYYRYNVALIDKLYNKAKNGQN